MIAKILLAAWLLMMPFVATASQEPPEIYSGVATVTIECELYFKAGKPPKILDCEIIGLEPHVESGE